MNKPGVIALAAMALSTCSAIKTGIPQTNFLEIPALQAGETVIFHTGFALLYNEKHEQAKWVAYELTEAATGGSARRANRFMPDPDVVTGTATDLDYRKSGYDRGHLAPAADMAWSEQAMKESFYYSNVSPQVPAFNRGIWKKLEEGVRNWARKDSSVYVVTGPVLQEGLPALGPNQVTIPAGFYKVILVYRNKKQQAIGFLIPNQKSGRVLSDFAVNIEGGATYRN